MAKRKRLIKKDIELVKNLIGKNVKTAEISDIFNVYPSSIESIKKGDEESVTKSDYGPEHAYYKLDQRLMRFNERGINLYNVEYTIDDVIAKFGKNPKCYLLGNEFDLLGAGFHLDHIVPKSRGGENSLENMGILSGFLNIWKLDHSLSHFLGIIKKLLEYQGCTITKPDKITSQEILDYSRAKRKEIDEKNAKSFLYPDVGADI